MPDGVPAKGSRLCMQESPTIYDGFLTPLFDLKYKMEWRSLGQYNLYYKYDTLPHHDQAKAVDYQSLLIIIFDKLPCRSWCSQSWPLRSPQVLYSSPEPSMTQSAGNSVSAHHWHVGTTDHRRLVREWRHQCSRFRSTPEPCDTLVTGLVLTIPPLSIWWIKTSKLVLEVDNCHEFLTF